MRTTIKNPFEHYDWTNSELHFAMVFTGKKERILVGTKEGILAHLQQRGKIESHEELFDDMVQREEKSGVEIAKTIVRDIGKTVMDTMSSNIVAATKEEQKRIYSRAERELPMVCDRSYDLGHFLLGFERDPEKKWDEAINNLTAALKLSGKRSREYEAQAKEFLQNRWDTRDPVCRFAALKIWQDYCAVRRIKAAGEEALIPYRPDELPRQIGTFSFSAKRLADCFWQRPDAEPNVRGGSIAWNDPILRLPPMLKNAEDELHIWTIDRANFEIIVLARSFYPLKQYYRVKMNNQKMKFARCIVCGNFFATNTRKQETCGKVCAKLRKAKTTARYHEQSKGDEVELVCKQAYQYWYNRVQKAKQIGEFPKEQMDALLVGFESFKRERKIYKKRVTQKSISMKEFRSWILTQENLASEIMGKYDERWHASR